MKMQLRPYQEEAKKAVLNEWDSGRDKTLLVLPTGCGKTVVFSKIVEERVKKGDKVLILAHRGELLEQASDKLEKVTGLKTSTEKANETSLDKFFRVTVGSIQTLMRDKRLNKFSKNHFGTIIVDEAHHVLSDSYQKVLNYFNESKILGVTATPDRGDMKNLGEFFESLAYEYTLPKAIKEGYLTKLKALTIPINIDLSNVAQQSGDYKLSDIGSTLDPFLEQISKEMWSVAKDKKIVVFLPLIETSKKMVNFLNNVGFNAVEVNGDSENREEILKDFEDGKYNVLCNSMLLTEGWDCPSVDCVVVLRPTKVRSLYTQMVGRGTRLFPGKEYLLILDFLWHTEKHSLCRPSHLITTNEEVQKKMDVKIEQSPNEIIDIEDLEKLATEEVLQDRENSLAEKLKELKKRKRQFVDPIQFELSIQDEDLSSYVPNFGWEMAPASKKQLSALEKFGIDSATIDNTGKATLILNKLIKRKEQGLATPKQIRFLERKGFNHVGTWSFENAQKMIARISANHWMIPRDVTPSDYKPM
ncbi:MULTISPECIES: DEAD/DEAH box helicase [Helcococcus]|uniref:DEAD/DEAH box helicase n=1 Tax=Helcococcus bovis TaxID=3153252 RepID=A0ABW9F7K4_9FIRM